MKPWKHFRTITKHKNLVMVGCFKIGLIKQGLLHDMSKYSPSEFWVGAKYYQGFMSPNNAERKDKGVSMAWLHHKGRNKHHLEYWIDYAIDEKESNPDGPLKKDHGHMGGMKMPIRYVCEMFIDRVSASKNYQKEKYTNESALLYFYNSRDAYIIHQETALLLEYMLTMLAVKGEKETYAYVKKQILKGQVPYESQELENRIKALNYQKNDAV